MKIFLLLFSFFYCSINIGFAKYKQGHYYDNNREKHIGYINFDWEDFIKFRSAKNGKASKFYSEDIMAFVIGEDSFLVARGIRFNYSLKKPIEFVQVLVSGAVDVVKHVKTRNSNTGSVSGSPIGISYSYDKTTYFARRDRELFQRIKNDAEWELFKQMVDDNDKLYEYFESSGENLSSGIVKFAQMYNRDYNR